MKQNGILKYFFWILFLVLGQILVLNQLNINSYVFPYIYTFIVLFVPRSMSKWLLLIFAFALGLFLDAYMNTFGIHAFACTLIAYLKIPVLDAILPSDLKTDEKSLNVYHMGFQKFVLFNGVLLFTHHFVVLYLEFFELQLFLSTLFKVLVSSFIALLLVTLVQYIFVKKP